MGTITNALYAGIAALAIAGGMPSPAYAQPYQGIRNAPISIRAPADLRSRLEGIVRPDGSKLSWEGCATPRSADTSCVGYFIRYGEQQGKSQDTLYAYANELAQMKDCRGKYLFSGALIEGFQSKGGTASDAALFSFITNGKGDRCLEASDMLLAKEYGMDPGEIKKIVAGKSMAQSTPALIIKSKLGEISYGLETLSALYANRPSALIVLPAQDYNGAFFGRSRIELFNRIRENYRTYFGVADTKDSLFGILGNFKNLKVGYIAGHGEYGKGFSRVHFQEKKRTQAGEPLWSIMGKKQREEQASIGPEDAERLKASFQKSVARGALIIVDSCGSATGPMESSVGNAVIQAVPPGSTVILSRGSQVKITNLEESLGRMRFEDENGDNLTFTVDIPPADDVPGPMSGPMPSPKGMAAGHILDLRILDLRKGIR